MRKAGYRWHVDAAKVPTPVWTALREVFEAYRKNKIEKQPTTPFTATPFKWMALATDATQEEMIETLTKLSKGEITWLQFKQFCAEKKV